MDATRPVQAQCLVEERDRLFKEMEALRNQIAGLDMAIRLVGRTDVSQDGDVERKRVAVSAMIATLLREAGASGLKVKDLLVLASESGTSLNRGSVYTLLNRMTRSGTVAHENGRYILRQPDRRTERRDTRAVPAA